VGKPCVIENCERLARYKNGLCFMHYARVRIFGTPKPDDRHCDLCQRTFTAGAYQRHIKSNYHKNMKRFKALLATNCVTLAEIGARLGFSRERARQIADSFGVKGVTRQKICTFTRREAKRRAAIEGSPLIRAARKICEHHKLEINPTGSRTATINNRKVRFGRLDENAHNGNRDGFFRPGRMRPQGADILCFIGPTHCWIVPARDYTIKSRTMFSPDPVVQGSKGYRPDLRHDWPKYIDAFHLFGKHITKQ